MTERVLPASPATERVILGMILLDDLALSQTAGLCSDDFSFDSHQRIYRRMLELHTAGISIDPVTLADVLSRHKELETVGGIPFVASLTDGLPQRTNVQHYCGILREYALRRSCIRAAERAIAGAMESHPGEQVVSELGRELARITERFTTSNGIPEDVLASCLMRSERPRYLVDELIVRGSMVMLAAPGGAGKSFLTQHIAVEVARGGTALGRRCDKTRALVLDRENPAWIIRDRMVLLAGGYVPGLTYWTKSAEADAGSIPEFGSPLLLRYAREHQPLIIFDSLTRFLGDADENDASELRQPMSELRNLANAGATVFVIHHKAKSEGSLYRGSSDLSAACDMVFSMNQNEAGLLQLHCHKNRFGPEMFMTIRPDFAHGRFELVSNTETARSQNLDELSGIIESNPGLSQRQILKRVTFGKKRAAELLRAHVDKLWRTHDGPRQSDLYYPLEQCGSEAAAVAPHCGTGAGVQQHFISAALPHSELGNISVTN